MNNIQIHQIILLLISTHLQTKPICYDILQKEQNTVNDRHIELE